MGLPLGVLDLTNEKKFWETYVINDVMVRSKTFIDAEEIAKRCKQRSLTISPKTVTKYLRKSSLNRVKVNGKMWYRLPTSDPLVDMAARQEWKAKIEKG